MFHQAPSSPLVVTLSGLSPLVVTWRFQHRCSPDLPSAQPSTAPVATALGPSDRSADPFVVAKATASVRRPLSVRRFTTARRHLPLHASTAPQQQR